MNAEPLPLAGSCPLCGGPESKTLVDCGDVPVFCNVLYRTRDAALQAERDRLRLVQCFCCGMIYNSQFDPARVDYAVDYENAQHFSPKFQDYLEHLVGDLVRRYSLSRKSITELGCGDARFLSLLCAAGDNRGTGFDPSARTATRDLPHNVTIVPEPFNSAHDAAVADFVCCRHVLEHVANPRVFLGNVRSALDERPDSVVYFEVPNTLYTLNQRAIWDLLYEHCLYFTPASLAKLFGSCGFAVLEIRTPFSDQFLSIEAAPTIEITDGRPAEQSPDTETQQRVEAFSTEYRRMIRQWSQRLCKLFAAGKRVVVWGAGTKGVMFLNSVRGGDEVRGIVDINPRKQGCHVAGTGQPIVAPAQLKELEPDVVLLMNPIYRAEIRSQLNELGIACELIAV